MPPFSQCGQGTAEANQKQHAQRLANSIKVNHGAVVYTWSGDDNFQSEFGGLHPQIALARICSRLQLCRHPLGTWVGVIW